MIAVGIVLPLCGDHHTLKSGPEEKGVNIKNVIRKPPTLTPKFFMAGASYPSKCRKIPQNREFEGGGVLGALHTLC